MLDILLPLGTTAIFGFSGSLHCAAMCSAVVNSCQKKTGQYFLTRSISYTILGFFAGLLGVGFFKNFLHISSPILSIFIAVVCLVQIVFLIKPNLFNISKRSFLLTKITNWILKYSPFSRAATFGLITALLPCGFLYAALLLSVSYANPFISAASMFVFSVVTTPILIGGKSIFGFLARKFYGTKKIIFSFLLVIIAVFSLFRGGIFNQKTNSLEDVIVCHPHFIP